MKTIDSAMSFVNMIFLTIMLNTFLLSIQCSANTDSHQLPDTVNAEGYDMAKLLIWSKSIEDVIDYNLTTVCATLVRTAQNNDETPKSACDKITSYTFLMRFTCTNDDVDMMIAAVCSYDSIVLPEVSTESVTSSTTPPSLVLSSSSSPPSPKDETPELTPEPSSSPESSTHEQSATSTVDSSNEADPFLLPKLPKSRKEPTKVTNVNPNLKSSPSELAPLKHIQPHHDVPQNTAPQSDSSLNSQPNKNVGEDTHTPQSEWKVISQDSRFSKSCNTALAPLSLAVTSANDMNKTLCKELRHLSHNGVTLSNDASDQSNTILKLCSLKERQLLHELLCETIVREVSVDVSHQSAHALQGEQKEDVQYVIKSSTNACRDALSPLGSVEEDVADSCWTLSGAEGDKLVENDVCTRQDLDSLIEAVCSAAPSLSKSTMFTLALCVLSFLQISRHVVLGSS